MDEKLKYREYVFNGGELVRIKKLTKLPKYVEKPSKEVDVWVTPNRCDLFTKICKIDSKIDFGTGRTE